MLTHIGTQVIETERLTLRRFTPGDADMVFRNWANDEQVSRFMRWTAHKSVEETRQIVAEWSDSYASDRYYHWGICLKDGEMIGSIGILGIDENDERAEVAYCVGRRFWGRGYTAEAVAAAFETMFARVGLNRIEAYHAVDNAASGRVMQKAGMTLEGHARQKYRAREGFQDCDLYGITREDWAIQREIAHYNALPCAFERFIDLPTLDDGEIALVCFAKNAANPEKKWVPCYDFAICKGSEKIGDIYLRIGYGGGAQGSNLYYGGQIGYNIDERHRGNGYAGRACRLLSPVAKFHKMEKLLITNANTNDASRRVCEKLGARLVRVAPLPDWHDLYKEGHRYVNIFEWCVE